MPAAGRTQNAGWSPDSTVGRGMRFRRLDPRTGCPWSVRGSRSKHETKHVEAAIWVVSGRGFDSPRLHSDRCWISRLRQQILDFVGRTDVSVRPTSFLKHAKSPTTALLVFATRAQSPWP